MKRSQEEVSDSESAEMSVDDETKEEVENNDSREDDLEDDSRSDEFLNAFYGLAAPDARTRTSSAQVILKHARRDVNDATYCFRRLLNGLCSGRAAARQGNATAFQSFVRLVDIGPIQQAEGSDLGKLAFLRKKLLKATEPDDSMGKVEGLEERDLQFGRLFGILALVRSGILLTNGEDSTTLDLVKDLVELYRVKSWMREPAAHAIGTVLQVYYAADTEPARSTLAQLVDMLATELLEKGDITKTDATSLLATYSAEQVAICASIQAHAQHFDELPRVVRQSVFAVETIPQIVDALVATSSVTQPRTHLVWDTIVLFLTETDKSAATKNLDIRRMRSRTPVGDEICADVLEAIVNHVIKHRLMDSTHERRALGLCLVRNFLGVEFVSSVSGRTRLVIDGDVLERSLLSSDLIRKMFVDVICAGGGNQSSHILKPLAIDVLAKVVESAESPEHRFALVRSLTLCESRFDGRTKTNTISGLMQFGAVPSKSCLELWAKVSHFLEDEILKVDDSTLSSALGMIDLLFRLGQEAGRNLPDDDKEIRQQMLSMTHRVSLFFGAAAFFDCAGIEGDKKAKKKHKKATNDMITVARTIQSGRPSELPLLPYKVRVALSSRFFSLLCDRVNATLHSAGKSKEMLALDVIEGFQKGFENIEAHGASTFAVLDFEAEDEEDPVKIVHKLISQAKKAKNENEGSSESSFSSAVALLAILLQVQLQNCGKPEEILEDEDPDVDDGNDAENIVEMLGDIDQISDMVTGTTQDEGSPLIGLSELCVSILSSPLSTGNLSRGSAPKLTRDLVKLVWTSGLMVLSSKEGFVMDEPVMSILLSSIGVSSASEQTEDEEMDDEASDSEGSVDASGDAMVLDGPEAKSSDKDDSSDQSSSDARSLSSADNENEDIELDATKLQSFLEHDSDMSVEEGTLEHHEGADAALAQLIRLRQEGRKAAQEARERVVVVQQQRCLVLLETAMMGKPEGWGKLLRVDEILKLVVPLLQYRRELEKSTATSVGRNEKRSFLDRFDSVIKSKILRIKPSNLRWSTGCEKVELVSSVSKSLAEHIRSNSSKEHQTLCNNALIFSIRCIPDDSERLSISKIYADAVPEWATKKSRRLEANHWEPFIQSFPVLAQLVLVQPMIEAAKTARSTFLQVEAFRILSSLFNAKLNASNSELDVQGLGKLDTNGDEVLKAVVFALEGNADMKKAKRAREVLKATDRVLSYLLTRANQSNEASFSCAKELEKTLDSLSESSDSSGIVQTCAKLVASIAALKEKLDAKSTKVTNKMSNSSKKSKKKKKKR